MKIDIMYNKINIKIHNLSDVIITETFKRRLYFSLTDRQTDQFQQTSARP